MPKITFIAFDGTQHMAEVDSGISLMEAARDNNITGIDAECGGACACATCHVYVDKEWFPVSGKPSEDEQSLLDFVSGLEEGSRLSCQINITDEMDGLVIRLPETQGLA